GAPQAGAGRPPAGRPGSGGAGHPRAGGPARAATAAAAGQRRAAPGAAQAGAAGRRDRPLGKPQPQRGFRRGARLAAVSSGVAEHPAPPGPWRRGRILRRAQHDRRKAMRGLTSGAAPRYPCVKPAARIVMSALFSPWTIGPLSLPNRIVVAPMCQYSAEDGRATDWHLLHLGHLALSGAGLLITEATAVLPEGRISPADLGLYDEATERALQPVVRAIRRHSPIRLGIQLAHAGRKASSQVPWEGGQLIPADQPGGWRPVAPSPVPLSAAEPAPLELDEAGLERVA